MESHTATDGEQVREQKVQTSTKLREPTVYIGSTGLEWNPGYCRVPFLSFNHNRHSPFHVLLGCANKI